MKRKGLFLISTVLVVIAGLFFYEKSGKEVGTDLGQHLKQIPEFDAGTVKGKPYIVHFWAKWCAPCAEEIPHLVDFARAANEKLPELRILAISLDQDLKESKTILPNGGEGLPPNLLLYLDPEHRVAEAMGSYQYPETYFFDSKGAIVEKWVGPQKWNNPEVFSYFQRKIKGIE
jgi:thiol-disulfide isomerase/thioredoxin